jgi:hypothetical protein
VVNHHVAEEESTVLPGIREQLSHHMGDRPGQARKEHLLTQAHNAGLTGVSGMSKEELARQLNLKR